MQKQFGVEDHRPRRCSRTPRRLKPSGRAHPADVARRRVAGAAGCRRSRGTGSRAATRRFRPRRRRRDAATMPADAGSLAGVFAQQLEIISRQLEMLGARPRRGDADDSGAAPASGAPQRRPRRRSASRTSAARARADGRVRPVPAAEAQGPTGGLTDEQQQHLAAFIERYNRKTAASKAATEANRAHLADPRSVAGFRQSWKEMVYPIVSVRSSGSQLWDVDGNEYVDLTNGFGMILFGHNPDFIREAVEAQLDAGIEIGPQTPLAGEVAQARLRDDRHGARRVLQHRLRSGHGGDPRRTHRVRPRQDRDVRRRVPRHLRRSAGAPGQRRRRPRRCRSRPAFRPR